MFFESQRGVQLTKHYPKEFKQEVVRLSNLDGRICVQVADELGLTLGTLYQKRRRIWTTDSNHSRPIAPNRVHRDFQANAPNRLWMADLTYIDTGEGWLYLAAILDGYSRKIVGW